MPLMTILLLPLPTPLALVTTGDVVTTGNRRGYAITFIEVPHLAIEGRQEFSSR